MPITTALEDKYLQLVLFKKFEEAIDFAKNNDVNLLCDNNYLLFKMFYLDQVQLLPILKKKGLLDFGTQILPTPNQGFYFVSHCLEKGANKCLNWLLEENLLLSPNFIKHENIPLLVSGLIDCVKSKVIGLNNITSEEKKEKLKADFDLFINYIFPINNDNNELLNLFKQCINEQIYNQDYNNTQVNGLQYTMSNKINTQTLTVLLEAWFLSNKIKSSSNCANPHSFKV